MMKTKPEIIPVSLIEQRPAHPSHERSISIAPTCHIKKGKLEISLHNGIDKFMVHAILEMVKDAG
ncbi:MAG: hypothetical protein FWF59_00020 [Turicibacter sp.]|nr:hypothetical protein [Turicibacter sp.]